jgi:hypothetical protein
MNIDIIKSKINVVEARIQQIKDSDMFTKVEKEVLLDFNESELNFYSSELAKNIEVVNPEIL